jgi:hypothetical protein
MGEGVNMSATTFYDGLGTDYEVYGAILGFDWKSDTPRTCHIPPPALLARGPLALGANGSKKDHLLNAAESVCAAAAKAQ